MGRRLLEMSLVAALIAIHSLVFHVANLYAQPKNQITQVDQIFQNGKRQPSCVDHRKQFSILFCERGVSMTLAEPFQVSDIDIPKNYGTSLIWEEQILKFSQELYKDPPKDLRKRASEVLRASIVSCAKSTQCENELLEYFGVSNKLGLRFPDLARTNVTPSERNESLASALGERLYSSDAGILIRKFIYVKECIKLKSDAKQIGCELNIRAP